MGADPDWREYLERFHHDAPGVTERMLRRSVDDDGVDPYGWAAERLPTSGAVVDVACGSAPLADHVGLVRYVGIDRSAAELAAAAERGARVVRGDATALPVRDAAVDTATCLMALMLAQPLDRAVAEIARVVRPRGRLVVLLPGRLPDRVADALRWAAVLAALGEVRLEWPNPSTLDTSTAWLDDAFTVVEDNTRSFPYPIDGDQDAAQFVASLYLRGVPEERQERAERVVDRLGRRIGIPLRRIVALRR